MSSEEKVKLTDTEWKIMMVLWKESPLTCRQIEDDLKEETGWTRHTIISFLKRMMKKEYVRMEEANPARLYYPLLEKDITVLQETRSFAEKIFGGKMGLIVSSLADNEDITKDELNSMLQSLEKALKEIGVNGEVNLDKKTVIAKFDSGKTSLEQIITEIEDQGYEVTK